MKKLLLLSAIVFYTISSTFAQSKKDKIVKLFKLMEISKTTDAVFKNLNNTLAKQGANMGDSVTFHQYMNFVMQETKQLSENLMNVEMVNIYDKNFTEKEIDAYTRFYNTTEGKKLIAVTPTIQTDLMNVLVSKYLPSFQEKLKTKMQELEAKKTPAAADTKK